MPAPHVLLKGALLCSLIFLTAVALLPSYPPPHPCHLQGHDWWAETLTIEFPADNGEIVSNEGVLLVASTSDDCVCVIRVIPSLVAQGFDFTRGRVFHGVGWRENGEIKLEKVCEEVIDCFATFHP